MSNQKEIKVGQRFVDNAGLVHTVLECRQHGESSQPIQYVVKFDSSKEKSIIDVGMGVVKFQKGIVEPLKTFVLEEGKIYLSNDGYEHEFKIIQGSPDDFVTYVSDEGTQYSCDGQYIIDGPEPLKAFNIAGEKNEIVKAVLQERKFKQSDFVNVTVTEQEAIPPNSNAFHYDLTNMGTPLLRGWVILHEGYCREEDPQPAHYLILVNQISGQRIKLDFTKRS